MIQPKYNPQEALKRAKLMMGYDLTKTLTENEKSLKPFLNEQTSSNTVKNFLGRCSSRSQYEGSLDAAMIAAGFNKAFNFDTFNLGIGGTDDSIETGWRKYAEIMKKGNFDDLCNVVNEFKETFNQDLADAIVSELDDEEIADLMETFMTMKYRTDKESKLQVDKTEQKNINWFKKTFPCIFQSNGNVDQSVRKDDNNFVYILIKGASGKQYQVFADGRVKKSDGTATRKKVSCEGSKVKFIGESLEKKNLIEQIDDSDLNPAPQTQRRETQRTRRETPKPKPKFPPCQNGRYVLGCSSEVVRQVQECLGFMVSDQDGKFGKITQGALQKLGFAGGFTDKDVEKICKKVEEDPALSVPDRFDEPDTNL